eukprot:8861268-Pyramimonas_sp.AAC.1
MARGQSERTDSTPLGGSHLAKLLRLLALNLLNQGHLRRMVGRRQRGAGSSLRLRNGEDWFL